MANKISYHKAKTLEEAIELLSCYAPKAKPYCGGTDIMVQLWEGANAIQGVEHLVDISGIEELRSIVEEGREVRIGAAVTHTGLNGSVALREYAEFLCDAAGTVGSPQIRNAGTIGGNICNASLAADTLSPLVALDAEAVISGPKGERRLPVKDMMVRGGQNALEHGEIVRYIAFERLEGYGTAFIKLGRRKALAISRMNMAVALKLEGGLIEDIRIAPGCVFSRPDRAVKAEAALKGQKLTVELAREAGKLVSREMIERTGIRWSTEYKQPAVEALTERALLKIIGQPEQEP